MYFSPVTNALVGSEIQDIRGGRRCRCERGGCVAGERIGSQGVRLVAGRAFSTSFLVVIMCSESCMGILGMGSGWGKLAEGLDALQGTICYEVDRLCFEQQLDGDTLFFFLLLNMVTLILCHVSPA